MTSKDKLDKTTSTERLLDIIRGKSAKTENNAQDSSSLPPRRFPSARKDRQIKAQFPEVKKSGSVSIGIEIGIRNVNMVKVARSGHRRAILEYKSVSIPANIEKGSREFIEFLKSAVPPFCNGAKKIQTWAIMSYAQVEIRNIRVPDVSGKNLEVAIHWTLKKESALYDKDSFFDYEIRKDRAGSRGDKKLNVMCYTAPFEEVEDIKKVFSAIGTPLSGVSTIPFAVQNIFKHNIMVWEKQTACLFFGTDHSRIDIYAGGRLINSRDVKTGMNSMIEMLIGAPDGVNGEGTRLTHEEAQKILFAFAEGKDIPVVSGKGFSAGAEEIGSVIAPVLERLARQLERTFEHFTTTLGYDRIEKVYISSVMPVYKAMLDYFDAQLGIRCAVFDPLKQELGTISLEERISFIPAYGIALSDNAYTPNFMYSRKDKKEAAHAAIWNKAVLVGLILTVLICSSASVWMWHVTSQKMSALARHEQQLKSAPVVSKETVLRMAVEGGKKQQKYAELSRRYRAMALIGEISALTPETVSLTGLKADFAEKTGNEKAAPAGPGKSENTAIVEGFISGHADTLETTLASYVMKLRSSPMFSEVSVSTSKTDSAGKKVFLAFAINLKVGPVK